MQDFDQKAMMRCFQLAQLGSRNTKTNPMVGAVIAYHQKILGEGFHKQFGEAHAEINALNNVREQDKHLIGESTLYVSLEPCSHYGKTPPCAESIVNAGIRKVVIGIEDPSSKVAGKGIAFLKKHGVEVEFSKLRLQAEHLIRPFTVHLHGRPYIILKWAQSYDHFTGKEHEQIWISNKYSKFISHYWRSESDGILIGKNTALTDNPSLTTRLVAGENPTRIVLDRKLEVPDTSTIFDGKVKTIIFNSVKEDIKDAIVWKKIPADAQELPFILKSLFDTGIYYLIVEGGTTVLKSFIKAGFWDEARYISSKSLLHEGIPAPTITGHLSKKYLLETDEIKYVLNLNPKYELFG